MPSDLDTRPRRVWLELTAPGKTMMRVLESRDRLLSRQSLTELYKDEAHAALYSAALALHLLPRHVASKRMRYSVVLADIRDFLSFRFRAKVSPNIDSEGPREDEIMADTTDAELINHVIERLDDLSRQFRVDDAPRMADVLRCIRQLRELLKIAARRLYPGEAEEYAVYEAIFAESR